MQSRERKTPVPVRPAMDPEKPLPAPQRTQPACSLNWKPSRGKKKGCLKREGVGLRIVCAMITFFVRDVL
jgi:hypothetical protein